MSKETEILDALEKLLIISTKSGMRECGKDITDQEAKNLLGKIGIRIMFSESLGQERTDELIFPKNPNPPLSRL